MSVVGGLASLLMCGYQDIAIFGGITDYGFADVKQSKPSRLLAKRVKRERKKTRKTRRKKPAVETEKIDLKTLIGKNDDELDAECVALRKEKNDA